MRMAVIRFLLLSLGLMGACWGHPHISSDEAAAVLASSEAGLDELRARHGGPPPTGHPDVEEWRRLRLQIAECHYLQGEVALALEMCNDIVQRWGQWPDVYSLRRLCYLSLGKTERSDADSARYLQLGAGSPALALELVSRPLSDEDPEAERQARQLRVELLQRSRERWPAEPALWGAEMRQRLALDQGVDELLHKALADGPDDRRLAVVTSIYAQAGGEHLGRLLAAGDHDFVATPPAPGSSDERLQLARYYQRAGLGELSRRAAQGVLQTLEEEQEMAADDHVLGDFRRLGIAGDRARAWALVGEWQQALDQVDKLLEQDHDRLTWLIARIHCLRALGQETAAAAARAEYDAFFREVGLEPLPELEPWP